MPRLSGRGSYCWSEGGAPGVPYSLPIPIAFRENDAGIIENRRGLSCRVVVWEPVILPLLFLPKPNDVERREESIDCLGVSAPTATAPVMLTGGYDFFGFSCVGCSDLRKIEPDLPKMLPMVFDLLCVFGSGSPDPCGKPAIWANLDETWGWPYSNWSFCNGAEML